MSKVNVDLGDLLAKVLPADVKVTIRHVSSVPTTSVALFAAAPGEDPEPTFCGNHFLSVSVSAQPPGDQGGGGSGGDAEIIVFGMEVLVYTTSRLTTIFVSKADSTGHLHLLKAVPKSSLLRRISNTFLSFLVQTHQRSGVRLVVSLFARSQNQYLYPGSIENAEKHVLDDRGLIKWWCRAIDPILREYEPESSAREKVLLDRANESAQSSATAYLIVPGCDKFETRGFFPSKARSEDKDRPRWLNNYPVHQLCGESNAPPRCLVPRLPDDPKTRFLVDLDDELPEQTEDGSSGERSGQWRSVKYLDQFWEMMSFRQECSAGRLVGFIWLVINPPGVVNSIPMASRGSTQTGSKSVPEIEATTLEPPPDLPTTDESEPVAEPIDQIKTQKNDGSAFSWPQAGRGHAVLSEPDYKTAVNFLLEQDFYNEEVSFASTKAWNEKVASLADELWVGQQVVGRSTEEESTNTVQEVQTLLVRKRKKDEGETIQTPAESKDPTGPSAAASDVVPSIEPVQPAGVNVLQANLIRKKKKS